MVGKPSNINDSLAAAPAAIETPQAKAANYIHPEKSDTVFFYQTDCSPSTIDRGALDGRRAEHGLLMCLLHKRWQVRKPIAVL